MLDNVITKEVKFSLSSKNYSILNKIIKEENPTSILASLNENLVKKYFEISIKSKNIFFYVCEYRNEIVGYAILARKPSFLISEFKEIRYSILMSLLLKISLKTILNIILAMYKIDLLLISKLNKNFISESLNLNLLAIDKSSQSKGVGRMFVLNILKDMKDKCNSQIVTVETNGNRAISFYQDKLEFDYIGKKIRFFRNMNIYKRDF